MYRTTVIEISAMVSPVIDVARFTRSASWIPRDERTLIYRKLIER